MVRTSNGAPFACWQHFGSPPSLHTAFFIDRECRGAPKRRTSAAAASSSSYVSNTWQRN